MEQLTDSEKLRIKDFIEQHDLDFKIVEPGTINKYHLFSFDKKKLFINKYLDKYVVIHYDPKSDKPGSDPYKYYYYDNLQQVLEQLSVYDNSIPKQYWMPITNSIDIGFNNDGYNDEWCDDFLNGDCWKKEDCDKYKSLVYDDPNYKPKIKSPYYTLDEVSPINDPMISEVGKLYFEIHPISLTPGEEEYHFKIQSNDEEILKEWINYLIVSKKGLKMFLDTIFSEMEQYKLVK